MSAVRRIARPLLAASFVAGGVATLRDPEPRVRAAADSPVPLPRIEKLGLTDDARVVRANAALMIGGGLALATGRLPRLASAGLALSLAPTAVAGHRFWEEKDRTERAIQRAHLVKDAGLLGGLLLASVDTDGKESLPRRARRVGRTARSEARRGAKQAGREARRGAREARRLAPGG